MNGSRIPVIVLAGYAFPGDVDAAYLHGSVCLWADFVRRASEELRLTAAGLRAHARGIRAGSLSM